MVVEDESGATFFEAFDHVMLPIDVVDPSRQVCIIRSWPYSINCPL
jgi:hypothetical protein